MATTELLSGCFCERYQLSLLWGLFDESDGQPELFNINENKPMQPSTISSSKQIFFFNIKIWKSTWQPWKVRLIPLVLPNWNLAPAGDGGGLSTSSLALTSYLQCCSWEGWGFFLVRGYSQPEHGPQCPRSHVLHNDSKSRKKSCNPLSTVQCFWLLSVTGEHHW